MQTNKSGEKKFHLDKSYMTSPLSFGSTRLYQIGRLYCTGETVIGKHAHIDWFELTVVTDGKGSIFTNDTEIPVKRGDIYLSFPCDVHGIVSHPAEPLKYDFFAFNTTDEELAADLYAIVETRLPANRRILRDETIRSLIAAAILEVDQKNRYRDKLLDSLFREILIRVIRAMCDNLPAGHPDITEPEALCYRLMNYIDTHIYTMTGLQELSALTNYNYSYLSSLFREVTAGTLSDYYRNRRLEIAGLLIAENKFSITHISELLNYSSIYTFSRAFKDQYGMSPKQYRKANAREE